MTDPGPQEPRLSRLDDPTRDIRLPPAPGSPPLVVRPEWSSYTARQEPVPVQPTETETVTPPAAVGRSAVRRPMDLLADEPTDHLVQPPAQSREPTLEFTPGNAAPSRPAPVTVVPERDRNRRWLWVLMALLPIIVIVGSGIWLFILLSRA